MASPVDKRLLSLIPPVSRLIARAGVTQAASIVLVLARGVLIGWVAAQAIIQTAELGAPQWDDLLWPVIALVAVVVLHGVVSHVAKQQGSRSVGAVVDTLRVKALDALRRRDPRQVQEESAHWRTVLTDGIAEFRPYLSEFLPSLVALVLTTPAALLVVFFFDPLSGMLAVITLPLIPLFMVLIGKLTATHTERRLRVTSALGGQLADLLSGAVTLRSLGAVRQPSRQLRSTGEAHEKATMGVLRLAFLSSFALEFLATLSVALVAVNIGLRLVYGEMGLVAGLIVLIIIPEVYNPVRQVGQNYHAAADGLSAAEEILDLLESDVPAPAGGYLSPTADAAVTADDLSIDGRDGVRPAHLSFTARPGTVTVLYGPNGSGKSTVFLAVLGMLPDAAVTGGVSAPPTDQIAYLPARPVLAPGTVASNTTLLDAQPALAGSAAAEVGLDLPPEHAVYDAGRGVSAGQGQRIALARALARADGGAPVLLLDEPSAHLSPELVAELADALLARAARGDAVIIASHDDRMVAIADEVVHL